jgi:hypothetical protein
MKAIRRTILSGHSIDFWQISARDKRQSTTVRQCVAGCLALLIVSASGCGVYRAAIPVPITPFLMAEALELDETLCSKTFARDAEASLADAVASDVVVAASMTGNNDAMAMSVPSLLPTSDSDVHIRTVCYGAGPDDFSLASGFRQAQEAIFIEANSNAPIAWECEDEAAAPSLHCAAWDDSWMQLTAAPEGVIVSTVPFLVSETVDIEGPSLETVDETNEAEATESSLDSSISDVESPYASRAQLMQTLLSVEESPYEAMLLASPLSRFWRRHLSGLEILIEVSDENDMSKIRENATVAKRELIRSLDDLGGVCDLQLRNASFCDSIRCFGSYTEFEEARFEPGQLGVYFYVEAENLTFEIASDLMEVKTSSYFEILDVEGNVVIRVETPVSEQYYSVPRHEYFFSYEVEIPEDLAEGDYVLSLTLTDLNGTKSSATELGFSVVSP